MYNFKEVEKKWQDKWFNEKSFKAVDFHPTKPKYYVLYEFYNISGNLHMGHLKGTVPADALSRMKRLQGYNVLFPIGGDAFGLPAENAAIKTGINPEDFVKNGMEKAMEQSRRIGLSFDWDRTICTSDPSYYKWTQWIFKKFLENGKAYKQKGVVNFCPNCKTVLSNEDSQDGECDRCHGKVVQEDRWVWFLKMKEYSEKLLENVDRIDMNENLKELQRNWIGKSEGMEISFDIVDKDDKKLTTSSIFTTCIETIYGITFFVMAPEHKLIDELKDSINNYDKVKEYQKQTTYRSELDRISDQKEKTGCVLDGIYAINPINNKKVPIYISDFVLANYGTGIVMAVPTHDQRDYEFAKKFDLDIIPVLEGGDISKEAYVQDGTHINSEFLNGLNKQDAINKIISWLEERKIGTKKINYKLREWIFARQRYWGEPIPIVYTEDGKSEILPDDQLPLILPELEDYSPSKSGASPLDKATSWVNTTLDGKKVTRETSTMPGAAGSSWYFLRYIDPKNENEFANQELLKHWMPVDLYVGGPEHAVGHLLYSRFWNEYLFDKGLSPVKEPFAKLRHQGMILGPNGEKMSKSKGNVINPDDMVKEYGADALRVYEMFMGPIDAAKPWDPNGIDGSKKFLDRVWRLYKESGKLQDKENKNLEKAYHYTVKKVTNDYETMNFNTAISQMMIFINAVNKEDIFPKEYAIGFLKLLNPVAPHITEELWATSLGNTNTISYEKWPEYDESKTLNNEITLPIQINGKLKATIKILSNEDESSIKNKVHETIESKLDNKNIVKEIYVKNKIYNIVVK